MLVLSVFAICTKGYKISLKIDKTVTEVGFLRKKFQKIVKRLRKRLDRRIKVWYNENVLNSALFLCLPLNVGDFLADKMKNARALQVPKTSPALQVWLATTVLRQTLCCKTPNKIRLSILGSLFFLFEKKHIKMLDFFLKIWYKVRKVSLVAPCTKPKN